MKIIDKDGEWLVSIRQFDCVCPNTQTRFSQGNPVKIKPNAWIEARKKHGDLVAWADAPSEPAKAPAPAPAPAPKPPAPVAPPATK